MTILAPAPPNGNRTLIDPCVGIVVPLLRCVDGQAQLLGDRMTDTPTTIDDYISAFPAHVQTILQEVRARLRSTVPTADEGISYGIPALTLDGRYLVYFAGWKHHISVYPLPEGDASLDEEMAPYVAGKGTLKFPLSEPIPYELVERVAARLLEERIASGL